MRAFFTGTTTRFPAHEGRPRREPRLHRRWPGAGLLGRRRTDPHDLSAGVCRRRLDHPDAQQATGPTEQFATKCNLSRYLCSLLVAAKRNPSKKVKPGLLLSRRQAGVNTRMGSACRPARNVSEGLPRNPVRSKSLGEQPRHGKATVEGTGRGLLLLRRAWSLVGVVGTP